MESERNTSLFFIAHLLSGEVRWYVDALTTEVSETFNTTDWGRKMPPHITLKAPFKRGDIGSVEATLERFSSCYRRQPITYRGFGAFDCRVIYLSIEEADTVRALVRGLHSALASVEGMEFSEKELKQNLHVTIAKRDISGRFEDVWNMVNKDEPHFESMFDNVALLEHDGQKWSVRRRYELGS